MAEQAKVPAIRFAGFTDPWEQRKLGEIVSIGAGAPPSAFSAGNFLYVKVDDLNESSHFQFDSAQRVDANTAVKPIRKGSIIFAKRGAAILGNKVRVLGKTAYIDTNMMALEPRGVDADFLWLFINQTGLYRIADTSTIPQINNKHIEPYPVDIPNMAEQQAIGTFFSRLDDLITLHQRKYDKLVIFKKSMLEKMFPKDGESVPEIRFAGFTDPWEQRKFSEIVDVCSGRDYKQLDGGPIPVYGTGGYMTSVSEALSHNRDAIGIGRKGTIDKPYLLKAPFWTVDTLFYAIPKSDINLEFALCSFSNVDWKSKDESTGLPSLSKESINETVLSVPNVVEQNHLGSFFADLDRLITLHQRKLELLQNIKKSLLDKMFV